MIITSNQSLCAGAHKLKIAAELATRHRSSSIRHLRSTATIKRLHSSHGTSVPSVKPSLSRLAVRKIHFNGQGCNDYGLDYRNQSGPIMRSEGESYPLGHLSPSELDPDKQFYLSFVDLYDVGVEMRAPNIAIDQAADHLPTERFISPDGEDNSRLPLKAGPDDETQKALRSLEQAIKSNDTTDHLFELYHALPPPRAAYIKPQLLRRLIYQLSLARPKNTESTSRYLSIMNDMKKSEIPFLLGEWNGAMAHLGREEVVVTERNLSNAMRLWSDMEIGSKVRANGVTFNIIYDVASRAGKFALAEAIRKEMIDRWIPLDRYNLVSHMQNCGFQAKADEVRQAYVDFVLGGEIVDTRVLNTIISSLLRCDEPSAAENVYYRMQQLNRKLRPHQENPQSIDENQWEDRSIGKALRNAATLSRHRPELLAQFQDETSLNPNLNTFRILIAYHSCTSGDLHKITSLIIDMHESGCHLHGFVFLYLFKGFYKFGSNRYTAWSHDALISVWAAFLNAIEGDLMLRRGRWMAVWALRAFTVVSGKAGKAMVWKDIINRDLLDEAEIAKVEQIIEREKNLDR